MALPKDFIEKVKQMMVGDQAQKPLDKKDAGLFDTSLFLPQVPLPLISGTGPMIILPAKNKLTIKNAALYELNLLRQPANVKKYIEDPIAFMANRVWNYDLNNPANLVFGYRLQDEHHKVNELTRMTLDRAIADVINTPDLYVGASYIAVNHENLNKGSF